MNGDSIEDKKSIKDGLQCYPAESEDSLGSFEWINPPDPDEIQIAGFNKKTLLKMVHFCKITYGNNDSKLSQSGYRTKAEFIIDGEYNIIPFYYTNRTLAGFVFKKDKEITIAYRGTQNYDDWITNVLIILIPLGFLPEGGRAHCGFYYSFYSSWNSLDSILKTLANEKKLAIKDFKFYLTGHSMGGAIAKIAALFLNKKLDVQDLHVATLADPRVFDLTASQIYNKALPNRTIRVVQHRCDPVPAVVLGILGYAHVGEQLRVSVIPGYTIHKIDGYHQAIKKSDFQPDNSASIFYYPVRLLIIMNAIVFGNSQCYAADLIKYFLYQDTPYACFNAIENTNHMSVIPISTITSNLLGHNIQLRMPMMLEVRKSQSISMIKGNNFQLDNIVSIFYSSARVLTPVNNAVLIGLFYGISFNVDGCFSRKVGFITQDSGFSNINKRIKAIQNLNLVEEPVKSNVIQNDDLSNEDLELESNSSQQIYDEAINAYNKDGKQLIQCGANIEITSKAKEGHRDSVGFLLSNKANVNSTRGNKEFISLFTQSNTKKSELSIIAASTVTMIGITLGIVISIYLEMLAVGITVGVCLITSAAATFVYHCNTKDTSPKSSIEAVGDILNLKSVNILHP